MGKEELEFHPEVIELLGSAAELPPGEGLSELLKNWEEEPVHLTGKPSEVLSVYRGDPMVTEIVKEFGKIYSPVKVQLGAGVGRKEHAKLVFGKDGKLMPEDKKIDAYEALEQLNSSYNVDVGIWVDDEVTASAFVRGRQRCELNCPDVHLNHVTERIAKAGEELGYQVTVLSPKPYNRPVEVESPTNYGGVEG